MRFFLAFTLALAFAPLTVVAETNFSNLVANDDVKLGYDMNFKTVMNPENYNVNNDSRTLRSVTDKSAVPKWKAKVEDVFDGYHVDSVEQLLNGSKDVDVKVQGIQTTHLDRQRKLISYTHCAGEHRAYNIFQSRNIGKCVTITPEFCRNLSKASNGKTFEKLAAENAQCTTVAGAAHAAMAKLIDPNYKKEEDANIRRIDKLSKEIAPGLFKIPEQLKIFTDGSDGSAGKRDKFSQKTTERLQLENNENAVAVFAHMASISAHCANKSRFFADEPAPTGNSFRPQNPASNQQ